MSVEHEVEESMNRHRHHCANTMWVALIFALVARAASTVTLTEFASVDLPAAAVASFAASFAVDEDALLVSVWLQNHAQNTNMHTRTVEGRVVGGVWLLLANPQTSIPKHTTRSLRSHRRPTMTLSS